MYVYDILAGKGDRVVTIAPDATIQELAALLLAERIGAAIVQGHDDTVAGVISERDVVGGLARHGTRCLDMAVRDLMTELVIYCTPGMPIEEVMDLMTERRVRHLPVVENDRLAGIVSIGDAVKARIAQFEREAQDLRQYISA
jgi:CBS domain-containing protein